MLTCLLATGWHYLPNFKDVAAAVPLPDFIMAGETKFNVGGWGFLGKGVVYFQSLFQLCCLSISLALSTMLHHS